MTGYGDAAERVNSHPGDAPVVIARQGGVDLVRLAGEIDLANADAIGAEVLSETAAARAVLLDLTAVGFLDSAGVRLLDQLVGAYEDRGARVRIAVTPAGPVLLTLTLCAFRADLVGTDVTAQVAALGG